MKLYPSAYAWISAYCDDDRFVGQASILKQAYREAQVEMTEFLLKRGARLPRDAAADLKTCIDQCQDDPEQVGWPTVFNKLVDEYVEIT